MRLFLTKIVFVLVTTTLFASFSYAAEKEMTAEERGYAIFDSLDDDNTGDFKDATANLVMTLIDKKGYEVKRKMRVMMYDGDNDEGRSMFIFDSPKKIAGTTLLTHTHGEENDEQWLYLPKLKRVKKIASENKGGSFMGSEFSYDDMGGQNIDDYTYLYVNDEEYEGVKCHVVERFPKDSTSAYTRQVSWIEIDRKLVRKTDFYDRKKSLLKTMTMTDYELHDESDWRPKTIQMVNFQTKKKSLLNYDKYETNTGLKEKNFSKSALSRKK